MEKRCSKCHTFKFKTEFNKDNSKPDGLKHQCRSCHRALANKTYRDNSAYYNAQAAEYARNRRKNLQEA